MNSSAIKKFALETYGCQMNVADSELVKGILTNLGLEKTNDYDEEDAIFLNKCTMTEPASTITQSHLGLPSGEGFFNPNFFNFLDKSSAVASACRLDRHVEITK